MPQRLSLPYHRQKADGYCLAACAQMVLHYWGILSEQNQLAGQMGVMPNIGVPASRIVRLASREITPLYDVGEWELLMAWLNRSVPVIAMVQAGEFTHWQGAEFAHAVVVVGYDAEQVWLLDPAALPEPMSVSIDEFMLAWGELDYRYAVLKPNASE
ncbi:MAG: C39 family peptidase [Anaerolinea sp.]|nr:C39 family peptidase [Anaerolinea sp.]